MANENGWNKHDAWSTGLGLLGFVVSSVCTVLAIGQANKAQNQRIDEQNARLNPGIRPPNPPQM